MAAAAAAPAAGSTDIITAVADGSSIIAIGPVVVAAAVEARVEVPAEAVAVVCLLACTLDFITIVTITLQEDRRVGPQVVGPTAAAAAVRAAAAAAVRVAP